MRAKWSKSQSKKMGKKAGKFMKKMKGKKDNSKGLFGMLDINRNGFVGPREIMKPFSMMDKDMNMVVTLAEFTMII